MPVQRAGLTKSPQPTPRSAQVTRAHIGFSVCSTQAVFKDVTFDTGTENYYNASVLTVACVEDQYEGLKNHEVTAEDGCRPCPNCLVCDGDDRKVRHNIL